MMSRHFSGHKRQRGVFVAAAATASVLMAASAPVAAASPSSGGSGHPPPKPSHASTAPQTKEVSAVKPSAATPAPGITPPTPQKVDPNVGLNVGNPPFGMPGTTGNTDYGNQSNPASVQFYNLGTGNSNVANNVGTLPSVGTPPTSTGGPGVNLVQLGKNNDTVGNQDVEGANNFGTNAVIAGNTNTNSSGSNFVDFFTPTATGSFGSNLAFLGNTNNATGWNEVDGANSSAVQVASAGTGNTFSAYQVVNGNVGTGPASGVNSASVGDASNNSGVNLVTNTGAAGTFTFGANYATVLSTAAAPTSNSGDNTVTGPNLFGTNIAFVGAGSSDSGDNTPAATATTGGFNFAIINPGQTVAEGNNTGGGINIAIDPTTANPGDCAKALCINLFGLVLA